MYDVFVHLSKLFLLVSYSVSFKKMPDTKYDLIHKYDNYIERFDK